MTIEKGMFETSSFLSFQRQKSKVSVDNILICSTVYNEVALYWRLLILPTTLHDGEMGVAPPPLSLSISQYSYSSTSAGATVCFAHLKTHQYLTM